MFSKDTAAREWHSSWEQLQPTLAPYLRRAASCDQSQHSQGPLKVQGRRTPEEDQQGEAGPCSSSMVVDVGCGSSAMGKQVRCMSVLPVYREARTLPPACSCAISVACGVDAHSV